MTNNDKVLFERFQNEVYGCTDLGEHFSDASIEGVKGLLYADGQLYIETLDAGGYRLVLDRSDYTSHDLAMLERKLFDWAKSEGYFDDETTTWSDHDRNIPEDEQGE